MEAINTFYANLQKCNGDWSTICAVFREHFASGFTKAFVLEAIRCIGNDFDHVVAHAAGQTAFVLLNKPAFEYSIRIVKPTDRRRHLIKWLGARQIIGLAAGGPLHLARYKVPSQVSINYFEKDVRCEKGEDLRANVGEVVALQSVYEMLDFSESSLSVIEILTERPVDSELHWTFDQDLTSIYAEQSTLLSSRLENVLELARRLGKDIPPDLLRTLLEGSNPYLALTALRSMFERGHPDAFHRLERAIESQSDTLSQGAQRMLDALMASRPA